MRLLKFYLRLCAVDMSLATFAIFFPRVWMDAIHRFIGLGPLPHGPIVDYLARSTSFFYALMGALLWIVAADPRRFAPIIRLFGAGLVFLGIMQFIVDLRLPLPPWWRYSEGPVDLFSGLFILFLERRAHLVTPAPAESSPIRHPAQ